MKTTTIYPPQWVRDEAAFLEAGEQPWIEQCEACGEMFRTVVMSYWCDGCYDQLLRDEEELRSRGCYYCNEPVAEADNDVGHDWPAHLECVSTAFGDKP